MSIHFKMTYRKSSMKPPSLAPPPPFQRKKLKVIKAPSLWEASGTYPAKIDPSRRSKHPVSRETHILRCKLRLFFFICFIHIKHCQFSDREKSLSSVFYFRFEISSGRIASCEKILRTCDTPYATCNVFQSSTLRDKMQEKLPRVRWP